jgi:hypothetical protein
MPAARPGPALPYVRLMPDSPEAYRPFQPGRPSSFYKFDQAAAVHTRAVEQHSYEYFSSRALVHESVTMADGAVGMRVRDASDPSATPVRLALALGDFVHNARSGLDHLVWAAVHANGATPHRANTFPIGLGDNPRRSYQRQRSDALRGTPADFARTVDELRPWPKPIRDEWDHGHWLACLHALDIADKHHLLLPVVMQEGRTVVVTGADGSEQELKLHTAPPGPDGLLYDGSAGDFLRLGGTVQSSWAGVDVPGVGVVHLDTLLHSGLLAVGAAAARLAPYL